MKRLGSIVLLFASSSVLLPRRGEVRLSMPLHSGSFSAGTISASPIRRARFDKIEGSVLAR